MHLFIYLFQYGYLQRDKLALGVRSDPTQRITQPNPKYIPAKAHHHRPNVIPIKHRQVLSESFRRCELRTGNLTTGVLH